MEDGINDYAKNLIDLRRHMWLEGVKVEIRQLNWQIAVVGKYTSAKIHESNKKLTGSKNASGEEHIFLDRNPDDILKYGLQNTGFMREGACEKLEDIFAADLFDELLLISINPAINHRRLTDNAAQAVFRAAVNGQVAPIVFEIARSEIDYNALN